MKEFSLSEQQKPWCFPRQSLWNCEFNQFLSAKSRTSELKCLFLFEHSWSSHIREVSSWDWNYVHVWCWQRQAGIFVLRCIWRTLRTQEIHLQTEYTRVLRTASNLLSDGTKNSRIASKIFQICRRMQALCRDRHTHFLSSHSNHLLHLLFSFLLLSRGESTESTEIEKTAARGDIKKPLHNQHNEPASPQGAAQTRSHQGSEALRREETSGPGNKPEVASPADLLSDFYCVPREGRVRTQMET